MGSSVLLVTTYGDTNGSRTPTVPSAPSATTAASSRYVVSCDTAWAMSVHWGDDASDKRRGVVSVRSGLLDGEILSVKKAERRQTKGKEFTGDQHAIGWQRIRLLV